MENSPPISLSAGGSSKNWAVPPPSEDVPFAFTPFARPSPFSGNQAKSLQPLAQSQQQHFQAQPPPPPPPQPQSQSQPQPQPQSQIESPAETSTDPSPEPSTSRAVAPEPTSVPTSEQPVTTRNSEDRGDSQFFVGGHAGGAGKRKATGGGFFGDVPPRATPVATPSASVASKAPHESSITATTRPPIASTSARLPTNHQSPAAAAPKAKPRTSATSHHPAGPKKKPSESVETVKATSVVATRAQGDENDEGRSKRRKIDVEDLLAGVAGIQSRLDFKTKEVKDLISRLAVSNQQISKLQVEKDALKVHFGGRLRTTLEALAATKNEMDSTIESMRNALVGIEKKYGDSIAAGEIQRELTDLKEQIGDTYFSEEGSLWLERNEETKLAVLRSLENELEKHRGVISHLRDQLATKAGEITEARDRITTLEALESSRSRSIETIAVDLKGAGEDLKGASLAQSDLAKELRAWTDRNVLLQGELDEMRRAVKKAGEEIEKAAESYKDLKEKFDEAELVKKELQTQIDAKDRAERAAATDLEAFRARAQVEKDLATDELERKTSEITRLTADLASATKELTALRPVPGLLSSAHLELKQASSKLAEVTARADETAKHQKGLLADLQKALDDAKTEAEGRMHQIAKLQQDADKLCEEKRSETSLHGALRTAQASLASLESSSKSSTEQLATKLDAATSSLAALQLSSAKNDASRLQEQEEAEELKERFAELELKCTALECQRIDLTSANDELAATNDVLSADVSDREASERVLRAELETLKTALRQERDETDARVREAVKACAEKTERACKSQSSIEIASIKNELKKFKGLFDEKDKTLQRTLAELSKVKGRPGIDQSSSLDGDVELDSEPTAVAAVAAPVLPNHDTSPQHQAKKPVSPGAFNLTKGPAPVLAPGTDYVAPKPGKKKTPAVTSASVVDGETKMTTRRGRSTGRASTSAAATTSTVSDEIEDDDEGAFAEKRPATKTTYAKKKK
ncbi:hypothetical protein RQP46_009219 [Phenoliferia psychrophenolica]